MNFVAQVEDHLRDLGAEARKNHPGVKEASERAIINLRSLQTQYVAAVRRAGASSSKTGKQQAPSSGTLLPPQHPTTALFQSEDVLRPFLLAANYPDASYELLVIALESMQHLLRGDAVCPEDGIQISRVLVIQSWGCARTLGLGEYGENASAAGGGGGAAGMISGAIGGIAGMLGGHSSKSDATGGASAHHHHYQSHRSIKEDESIALKIMQTVTMLVDSRSVPLTQELLGSCLSICLLLGAGQPHNEHAGGEATVGASIRDRASNLAHGANAKDAGGATVGGNVKRAAVATMNQLLSILFERAKEAVASLRASPIDNDGQSTILLVAKRTLRDLCTIVRRLSASNSKSREELTGPFSVAAKEGLTPSPTLGLALVDMILKQACGDMFRVCFDHFHSDDESMQGSLNAGAVFATQIVSQAFQLGHSLLGSQYCYYVTKLSLESSLNEDPKPTSPSDLRDFCFFYYTASLTTTVLTHYLSSKSSDFYAKFDDEANADDEGGSISRMALGMIKQLVSFVSEATEAYHKSDDFEDGYIFTQTERESFDIGKQPTKDRAPSTKAARGTSPLTLPVSSISNEKLWRAFLSLEAMHHLVSSHLEQISWLDSIGGNGDGKLTVGLIAETASDFATMSTGNRERILHLLLAAHAGNQDLPSISHALAKSGGGNGDGTNRECLTSAGDLESENSTAAAAVAAKVTDALVIDSVEIPLCDAGETSWLAFKCIIFLVMSSKELALSSETAKSRQTIAQIVNGTFAPSVSMLQHFMRRMLGSPVIVTQALTSYEELACASMSVDAHPTSVHRQAILTSLCKLCLPSWGKRRTHSQLKESNIDALWTLLWIVHSHYEKISDEWDIILSTLDQLAILSISSSKLHNSYTDKAATIAGCFIRLPSFTTCFTQDTLSQFILSLVKLSEVVSFEPLLEQTSEVVNRELSDSFSMGDAPDNAHLSKEPSIGGKFMNFAGRAFGGSGGGGPAQPSSGNTQPSFRRAASIGSSQFSKTYSEDLREATCSQFASMTISTSSAIVRRIPLPLLLIAVVGEANSYRLSAIEEIMANHLCEIVAKSSSADLRAFAMEVLIHFMPVSFSKSEVSIKYGNGPLMVPDQESMNESPLEVIPVEAGGTARATEESTAHEPRLLKILCQTVRQTTQADTAESGLNALQVVLEGHKLSGENLILVIETLSVLSGSDSSDESVDRSPKQWANVSSLAFQCLKMIVDDFLEPISASSDSPVKSALRSKDTRDAILGCCYTFGKSRHDVNTALTATGMLWSIADRHSSSGTLDSVLSKLAFLAMDGRPEVRNCSVNTLFSCVVGLGEQFTNKQWEKCLNETIFGIMSGIASEISGSESKESAANGGARERYKVAVHHSRDSATKQWANTQILVLRGLERVLRLFFSRLLSTLTDASQEPWFLQTWKEILRVSFNCATTAGERETLDMRLAGVELMALCSQISSKAGLVASGSAARVGTNMEVVGGALRSVRAAVDDTAQRADDGSVPDLPEEVDTLRQGLFDVSFDKLSAFRVYLEENGATENNEGPRTSIDSLLSQVLTKLVGELTKLYECCKSNEMLAGPLELQLDIVIENDDGYESRFLHLLLVVADNAGNDENSRYLNQVQRGAMTLLQTMASNSSLRAFKALTTTSGDYMFVQPKALSSKSDGGCDDDVGEVFELEAAKTVATAFDSDDLSNEAKIVVMGSVLSQYLKIYGENRSNGDGRKASEARYDIITSVFDSGLKAAADLDSDTDNRTVLDSIWDRIIATVTSLLLPPADRRYEGYAHHSKAILNIVAVVLSHLPERKLALAEPMLENGAGRAVEVAFECNEKIKDDGDIPYAKAAEGSVHVFLACFMALCQKMPTCPAVNSLTNQILGDTLESDDAQSTNAEPQSKARNSLAIAVCESLRTATSQDLLVGVFPLLCRMTNVDNDGLRKAAGKILGGVNLAEAISRERRRADQAEVRAKEVEEENAAMLDEIEFLQKENEELQAQITQS